MYIAIYIIIYSGHMELLAGKYLVLVVLHTPLYQMKSYYSILMKEIDY